MKIMAKTSIEAPFYVTMDWAGDPITTRGDGYIFPRKAEMIIHGRYYPNGKIGEWPCDPETGERLPVLPISVQKKVFIGELLVRKLCKRFNYFVKYDILRKTRGNDLCRLIRNSRNFIGRKRNCKTGKH
jgi:hypothetical protein